MDTCDGSTLIYSLILLIILKSESCEIVNFITSNIYLLRVLISTVRDKGLCPCLRCLVRKTEIDKLGQKLDLRYHVTQACTYLGDIITSACNFIYKLG